MTWIHRGGAQSHFLRYVDNEDAPIVITEIPRCQWRNDDETDGRWDQDDYDKHALNVL